MSSSSLIVMIHSSKYLRPKFRSYFMSLGSFGWNCRNIIDGYIAPGNYQNHLRSYSSEVTGSVTPGDKLILGYTCKVCPVHITFPNEAILGM